MASLSSLHVPHILTTRLSPVRKKQPKQVYAAAPSVESTSRRALFFSSVSTALSLVIYSKSTALAKPTTISDFSELPDSGGVKALDLRVAQGEVPADGDQVSIHYYGRLAAKQGWRFDSTYDHKDETGEPIPFSFILGSDNVISGIQAAVRSMKVGTIRRVIIPPSQGYQNMLQEPLPPNVDGINMPQKSPGNIPNKRRLLENYMHMQQMDIIEKKNDIDRYLNEEPINPMNPSFDILLWWKDNSKRYKVLSLIARDVLAIPVSSVASESAFSTSGRILDPFRSSLSPKMVEVLVCTQSWLKRDIGGLKLNDFLDEAHTYNFLEEENVSQMKDKAKNSENIATKNINNIIDV